jgi:AraC family transcriptional regulator of adaptative response / DNA-3-methyladenine glycosylase II
VDAFVDDDLVYRAVQSRDPRFDGWFFVAVTTTGIYCRPSCSSVVPRRDRVRCFPTAAAAQRAGFRACKRCRPDASPGSPEWNRREDAVGRAMREIADGVVDREGVTGLADRLGYSTRQLNRMLLAEVGAGPLELARAQRAQMARILLETTDLRVAEVAFAAGFKSVRQFNDTIKAVFAESPMVLRARAIGGRATRARANRARGSSQGSGEPARGLALRLAFRPPFDASQLFGFLAARAVSEVEDGDGTSYRRALSLVHGAGLVEVRAPFGGETWLRTTLHLEDLRDLNTAVKRVRLLFDLDSDPAAVGEVLGPDPLLGPLVAARPGLRIPGHVDGDELAIRAVLGQQVSVAGARTVAGVVAARHGERLPAALALGPLAGASSDPPSTAPQRSGVVRRFPSAEAVASLSPEQLPMPRSRARALIGMCDALASGKLRLGPGADRDEVSARMAEIPGVGPWTIAYVRMRALADPDAFLPSDLGVRRALERAGLSGDPRSVTALGASWRPYRAYALQYLWAGDPITVTTKEETQ